MSKARVSARTQWWKSLFKTKTVDLFCDLFLGFIHVLPVELAELVEKDAAFNLNYDFSRWKLEV